MMTEKQIVDKIVELIQLVDDETHACGSNLTFYNKIAKAVAKHDRYGSWKLEHIMTVARAINLLKA